MNATIVLAMNKEYLHKGGNVLIDSLKKYHTGRICFLQIDFYESILGVECQSAKLTDIHSFRKDFPKNRPFYICAESGDFLDYFDFDEDEYILHIDADMILQREIVWPDGFDFKKILVTRNGYRTLNDEAKILNPKAEISEQGDCYIAALIGATYSDYKEIRKRHNELIYKYQDIFGHHATGQWVISLVIRDMDKHVLDVADPFHSACWYETMPSRHVIKNKELYVSGLYDHQKVIFNHTKFLKQFY